MHDRTPRPLCPSLPRATPPSSSPQDAGPVPAVRRAPGAAMCGPAAPPAGRCLRREGAPALRPARCRPARPPRVGHPSDGD
eukprot:6141515-Prymnesium_polylepis.2